MRPTKEFFEKSLADFEAEKLKSRIQFERHDAVVQFCRYMIENNIFIEEKEAPDGA